MKSKVVRVRRCPLWADCWILTLIFLCNGLQQIKREELPCLLQLFFDYVSENEIFYIKYIGNSKKVNSLFNFFYYFYYKYYFNCKKDIFFRKIFSFEGEGTSSRPLFLVGGYRVVWVACWCSWKIYPIFCLFWNY